MVIAFVQSCQKSQQLLEADIPASNNLDDPSSPCDTLTFSPTLPANATALQVVDPMILFIEAHIEKAESDSINYPILHDSVVLAINNLSPNASVEQVANIYHQYLNIDTSVSIAYFNNIISNASYISDEDNYETMQNALLYWACTEAYVVDPHKAQSRIFFRALARMLKAGCSMRLVAGVVDTAISGAVTLISSPTGIGLAAGAVSTGLIYGETIADAIDCHRNGGH